MGIYILVITMHTRETFDHGTFLIDVENNQQNVLVEKFLTEMMRGNMFYTPHGMQKLEKEPG